MPGAAEDRVDPVALHAFEEVPSEKSIAFHVADLGFDRRSSSQVAFQRVAELNEAAHAAGDERLGSVKGLEGRGPG